MDAFFFFKREEKISLFKNIRKRVDGALGRRVRSICLLSVQVAVEGKGWMVLAIDNYDYGIF